MSQLGPAARFGRNLAVVIGINDYRHDIAGLSSAVDDAVEVGRTLHDDHGFELWSILDGAADLARLNKLLDEELPAAIGPDDRLVFYFAGHGIALDGDTGPDGYLIPVDARRDAPASFLRMAALHDGLARIEARHVLVVLDCCFAGMFRWSLRAVETPSVKIYRERYDRYLDTAAWQVLTSGSGDQLVLDVLDDHRGDDGATHSPFARALLDGLAGAADYTRDNVITADELVLYIREQVESAAELSGRRQVPQLYPFRKHEDGEFVFQVPNTTLTLETAPPLDDDANPYRGLASFRSADTARFFGRDELVTKLAAHAAETRVTVVVGPSGCGKSSLVQAGAAPVLEHRGWTVLAAQRPGRDPLAALLALARAIDPAIDPAIDAALHDDPVAAWKAAVAGRTSQQPWLIIIDQLEELLTQTGPTRDAFFAALAGALETAASLHVIVTVRSDAEPRFRGSALWAHARPFAVPTMTRGQLREAIEKPALAAVLHFEPANLVERLLDDVALASAQLPLLSFALSELYRGCARRWQAGRLDRALRRADYDAMGGVAGALTERATALHAGLVAEDPAYEVSLRNVMTRMVADVGGEPARRRLLLDELEFGDDAENRRIAEIVRRLEAGRLISSDLTAVSAQPYVEPTHEELLRGWPQIGAWLAELDHPAGSRALRGAITSAETTWRAAPTQAPLWHADPRIEQAIALAARQPTVLNAHEARFIAESARLRDERRRRTRRNLIIVIAVLASAAIVASASAVRAKSEADNATASEAKARAREAEARTAQLVSEAHRVSALLEAPGGWLDGVPTAMAAAGPRVALGSNPPVLQGALARAVFEAMPVLEIRSAPTIFALAISGDDRTLVTGDVDGHLRLWRTDTGQLVAQGDTAEGIRAVAITHDGSAVVTAGKATACVWTTPQMTRHCTPPCDAEMLSVQLSPDDKTVLTTCSDRSHGVYEVPSGKLVERLDSQRTHRGSDGALVQPYAVNVSDHATFSPDGREVALPALRGGFELWSVRPPRRIATINPDNVQVLAAVFARDANRVLAIRDDHRVVAWDLAHRDKPIRTQYASDAAIAPDGGSIIVEETGAMQLIDLDTGRVSTGLTGTDLMWPAFSRDSERVIALGAGGLVRIWDTRTSNVVAVLRGHSASVDAVALSSSGNRIAVSGRDGVVRVWNTAGTAANQPGLIDLVELSPSGARAISGADDGSVRLWDPATGAEVAALPPHAEGSVFEIRFSDDGHRAITASVDEVHVIDADSGALLARLPAKDTVFNRVDISGDGRRVVTGALGGPPRLWDAQSGAPIETIRSVDGISQAKFGAADRVWLFLRTGASPVDPLGRLIDWSPDGGPLGGPHDDDALEAMIVAPDRLHVLTLHRRGPLRVGAIRRSGGARTALAAAVGEVHTESFDADAAFSPDGTRVVTFTLEPTARVWDTASGRLLATVRVDAAQIDDAVLDDRGRLFTHDSGDTVRVWSLEGTEMGAFDRVSRFRVSHDGTRMVAASGRRLRFFDLRDTAVFSAGCALLRGLCDLPALGDPERDKLREICAVAPRPACAESPPAASR